MIPTRRRRRSSWRMYSDRWGGRRGERRHGHVRRGAVIHQQGDDGYELSRVVQLFHRSDDVVKTDSVEHAITKGEFDDDTAPMTPNRVTETLAPFARWKFAGEGERWVRASELEADAFIVFRSLCKLAKKASTDLTNAASNRSKVLSLQLLKIIIENTGDTFSSSPVHGRRARVSVRCDRDEREHRRARGVSAVVFNLSHALDEVPRVSQGGDWFLFPMLLLKPLELTEGTPLSATISAPW